MCSPRPPAAITLPPRQPATKSALFSLILDVRLGLIQIPARTESFSLSKENNAPQSKVY